MTETEMMDLLHVICFIFLLLLFNSIEHIFFKIFIPKVKPSAIETLHRPSNTNNFLNTFSSKLTRNLSSLRLCQPPSKRKKSFSKKISNMNLKIFVFFVLVNKYKTMFANTFID